MKLLDFHHYQVKALVLDQESTQQSVIKKSFEVTAEESWLHGLPYAEKVFVVWDPPHLWKNVRNNLKKHQLKVRLTFKKHSSTDCSFEISKWSS